MQDVLLANVTLCRTALNAMMANALISLACAVIAFVPMPLRANSSAFSDRMAHVVPDRPLLVDYVYRAVYFPDPSLSREERDAEWVKHRENVSAGVYELYPHRFDFDHGRIHGRETPAESGVIIAWGDRGLADIRVGWYGATPYKYYRNRWWYDELAYPADTMESMTSGQLQGRLTVDRKIHSPVNSFLMAAAWLPFMLEPHEHETVSIVDSCRARGAELYLVRNVASHDGEWYYLFATPDDGASGLVLRHAARILSEQKECGNVLELLRSESAFFGDHVRFDGYREIAGAMLPQQGVWEQYRPRSRPSEDGQSFYRFLEARFEVTGFEELEELTADVLLQTPFEELPEANVRDWTVPLDDEPFAFNWEYVHGRSDAEQRDFAVEFVGGTYLSEEDIQEQRRASAPPLPSHRPWYFRWVLPAGSILLGIGLVLLVSHKRRKRGF